MPDPVVAPVVPPVVEPPKVEFTPEQQEHINKLFNQRFAKVSEKHESELREMSVKIEELKAAVPTTVPTVVPKNNNTDDNVRQMQDFLAQEKENTKNLKSLLEAEKSDKAKIIEANKKILKDQAIREAATSVPNGVEFHEINTVKKLTEDNVSFDETTNQWIAKENGVIKVNSSMEPMTLVEYYSAFASSHPYLVKGTVKSGVGSSESSAIGAFGGLTHVRTKADVKTTKDKVDYISKFGYEQWAKLPSR
jgi:hypothetical protein